MPARGPEIVNIADQLAYVNHAPQLGGVARQVEVLDTPIPTTIDGTHVTLGDVPSVVALSLERRPTLRPHVWNTAAVPDESTAARFAERVRSLRAHTLGWGSLIGEEHSSQLEKFVYHNMAFASQWYDVRGLVNDPPDTETFNADEIAFLRQFTEGDGGPEPDPDSMPQKLHTNKGDPTWGSGDLEHAAHIQMAQCDTVAELMNRFHEGRQIMETDSLPPAPIMTCLSRTGYTRRAEALGAFMQTSVGRILCTFARVMGLLPRRRIVMGYPNMFNQFSWAGWVRLERRMKRWSSFRHRTGDEIAKQFAAMAAALEGPVRHWADDAKSFDLSVRHKLYKQVINEVLPDEIFTRAQKDALILGNSFGLIAGPLDARYRAFIFRRLGTVGSGERGTSPLDTIINAGVVHRAISRGMGWASKQTTRQFNQRWYGKFQGDDTGLLLPHDLNEEQYAAGAAELGFTRSLEPRRRFLMNWFSEGYTHAHGLASRALMGTLTHEHRPAGIHVELFGAMARFERTTADPLFQEAWAIAVETPLFQAWNVRTMADLRRICTTEKFVAGFEAEVGGPGSTPWATLVDDFLYRAVLQEGPATAALLERLGFLRAAVAQQGTRAEILAKAETTNYRDTLLEIKRRRQRDDDGTRFLRRIPGWEASD